jgi:uncharacterized protein YqfA (UPF0365 family)
MTSYLKLYSEADEKRAQAEAELARANHIIRTFRDFLRYRPDMEAAFVEWMMTEHIEKPTALSSALRSPER